MPGFVVNKILRSKYWVCRQNVNYSVGEVAAGEVFEAIKEVRRYNYDLDPYIEFWMKSLSTGQEFYVSSTIVLYSPIFEDEVEIYKMAFEGKQ